MDFIRYGLIACILVTALVITNKWVAFKEDAVTQSPIVQYQQNTAAPSLNDVNNSDIASISDIPQLVATDNPSIETLINTDAVITVSTDTLLLTINLEGGDVTQAALVGFKTSLEEDATAFLVLENNNVRRYIAQSGLIGPNGTDTVNGRARYQATMSHYELDDNQDELHVDLTLSTDTGINIIKRFTLTRGSHTVGMKYLVNNRSSNDWQAALYAQLKRDNSDDPGAASSGMGMKPFLGAATRNEDKPYKKLKFKDFDEKPYKATVSDSYISIVQHYFISAWVPKPGETTTISTKKASNGDNLIRFTAPLTTVVAGANAEMSASLYIGPKDQYVLEKVAPGLELTVDYGWLWFIAQFIFWFLTKIHLLVGNWGWSIILLTVGIKLAFFRLSAASYRSMAKMRKLTPKMQSIRETYSDDKQKQSAEVMALYKKEKVNPLGGCLPILVQMPVFISLYWVLSESVELRHSPWMFWIHDLSTMDPYFILPLIMGVSMFFQQRLNPAPPDPMQAKLMQWLPVMFTFFFLFFPSGLVLYWVVNNLLSIAQQWVITRKIEAADTDS